MTDVDARQAERLALGEAFLQEAVYRSRARQAAGTSVLGVDLNAPAGPGTCGLGEKAAVELDLSERGEELFGQLWTDAPDPDALARIRDVVAAWVRRSDALDRKRNHFLRDFRQANGFDRTAYTPEQLATFEAGLEAVNAEVRVGLSEAARSLLDA